MVRRTVGDKAMLNRVQEAREVTTAFNQSKLPL